MNSIWRSFKNMVKKVVRPHGYRYGTFELSGVKVLLNMDDFFQYELYKHRWGEKINCLKLMELVNHTGGGGGSYLILAQI
jgi:hypothetical protein